MPEIVDLSAPQRRSMTSLAGVTGPRLVVHLM